MDFNAYLTAFPEGARYESYIVGSHKTAHVGVLQFTENTAHNWAGPFPGGFAAYHLEDCRERSWNPPLKTDAELFEEEKMNSHTKQRHT